MGEQYGNEPPKLLRKAAGAFFIARGMLSIVWDDAGGNRLIGKGKQFLEGLSSQRTKKETTSAKKKKKGS